MKLFKYTFGDLEKYGPADDEADAYERKVSIDHQFHYVPVMIEEVILEGYEIIVQPASKGFIVPHDIDTMDKEQLRTCLRANNIEFVPQWGESRLKELIVQQIQQHI